MTQTAHALSPSSITTATVRSVQDARVGVESASFGSASARVATAGTYRPRIGDVVLVAEADGAYFVIGVVRALREIEREITAEDGTTAAIEEDGALRLRDREGALIFEHLPGKSVVHVADDLEIKAGGRVAIEGAEGISLRSDGPVKLESRETALHLDRDRARITSELVETDAQRADLKIGEINLVARTMRTAIHRLRERVEHVERNAGRVVERAREVYVEVEELSQTKAGTLKLIAQEALTIFGGSTTVKAREDVKLKGEKIYLG
jgi:hypothetical protein